MQSSGVGPAGRHTRKRVIVLYRDELDYRYLDGWSFGGGTVRMRRHHHRVCKVVD